MDRGEPMMELITYPDGWQEYRHKEDLNGRPVYHSKVGDLGLYDRHIDNDGRVCYKIKNDKGEIVTRCSETGNLINRALGLRTTEDAWDRYGEFGDSIIYGDSNHNRIYGRILNKVISGINPSSINPDKLKSGDFVDIMRDTNSLTGGETDRLSAQGRGNTHTGTIFKPYGDAKGYPAYIIHNVGGDVYVDPLGNFGPLKTWSIMGIRRPGTKEHPYYED